MSVDRDSVAEMSSLQSAVIAKETASSVPSVGPKIRRHTFFQTVTFQVQLLIWKRFTELRKQPLEIAKILAPPLFFLLLIILLYAVFSPDARTGGLEVLMVPMAFWLFAQMIVVHVMFEKKNRLKEAMKMMGLLDISYWLAYFLFDAILIGFGISLLSMIMASTYGLFNGANLGDVFGLIWVYLMALAPFGFFLCSVFDNPETAGQVTLAIMLGFYVLFIALTLNEESHQLQGFWCLFPPLAFQLGVNSFTSSYDGIGLDQISGMLLLDTVMYSVLAWYFAQIWPSEIGVRKPFWFPLDPHYWTSDSSKIQSGRAAAAASNTSSPLVASEIESQANAATKIPSEAANEHVLGAPTVSIHKLKKTWDTGQIAVNELSFDMYANQIFVLMGHNGAGKTTAINVLTGLMAPDYFSDGSATIYGHDIHEEMDLIRHTMGVCPQHDVLFEHMSVKEHIMLFSQLKGYSEAEAAAEVDGLAEQFHLEKRLDHTGCELSGGQKRKLSVAIAICGGSKFVVLDEPTAGLDPLARRELWDLMSTLRQGRTILLTTHYMDEADVLGDRLAIMSLGQLQCIGSTQFLKNTFGAGYRLICNQNAETFNNTKQAALTEFVTSSVPGAKYSDHDGDVVSESQSIYVLPFDAQTHFGEFFTRFDELQSGLGIESYGVQITSMEDVFLKVGEDHSVVPKTSHAVGIGGQSAYHPSFLSQVIGITARKLRIAKNDIVTIPLIGVPVAVVIAAAVLYKNNIVSQQSALKDLVAALMYLGAYLGIPGLFAEFIVREREDRLRTVLTVMGCDFKAYWIGTFIADFLLMLVPILTIWFSWVGADMTDFTESFGGVGFFVILCFNVQLIAFSYICTVIFTSPKSAIAFMPMFIIMLMLAPLTFLILFYMVFKQGLHLWNPSSNFFAGVLLWGIMLSSPHGALFVGLLDVTIDLHSFIPMFPPLSACIIFMLAEAVLFLYAAYHFDTVAAAKLERQTDENFDPAVLNGLDDDVQSERDRTMSGTPEALAKPLRIDRLRKVFPPKRAGAAPVVAAQDVAFSVSHGEIFGLLGANGAGKTTVLSMLTRHIIPTAGDAFVTGKSILSDFANGARHVGVVTQNNSLWDLLSVEDHLYLFARLRGVPEDKVGFIVDGAIDQLELQPHRKKLAGRLSGGMKRKLCVAIALIGDPEVVLLDEPSAGLDPVSRRNLWNVILRTMSHRSVILTTHSMEEAEALCQRIGIMVKGQLRALGTKQHLKTKFGSGYELCMKLTLDASENHQNHVEAMGKKIIDATTFVNSIFPNATQISENGGLVTFQVPKEEMKMGLAFTQLEQNKDRLGIEDYSIAQPTLEQVFIRTVVANTDETTRQNSRASLVPAVIGGSTKMTSEVLIQGQNPQTGLVNSGAGDYEFVEPVNACGCWRGTVWKFTLPSTSLFFIFWGLLIAYNISAFLAIAVVSLVVACFGCNLLCCPCLQPPKGADE